MSNSNCSTRTEGSEPRLDAQMSWWGMTGLEASIPARSAEERVALIAEAGFDGINGFIPLPEEEDSWRRLLARYRLSFSVNAYPRSAEDLDRFLNRAKEYGGIQHVNVQVMTPFLIDRPAVDLLRALHRSSVQHGIPAYIETHRGTITQDLLRTVDYVGELNGLGLTIDLSHYVVAGEMHTISDEAELLFDKLLHRASAFHARVSNGEQVQVDVGDEGEHPMLQHFERWWSKGMMHWRAGAAPGDVLPFVVELGPPPYAITADEYAGRTTELGDRWKQSLLLLRTARRLWSEATAE